MCVLCLEHNLGCAWSYDCVKCCRSVSAVFTRSFGLMIPFLRFAIFLKLSRRLRDIAHEQERTPYWSMEGPLEISNHTRFMRGRSKQGGGGYKVTLV